MVDHPGSDLYKPHYYRLYGRLDVLTPERRIPDHMEQVIGEASDEEPCLIGCKAMTACLIPAEGVLSLLYPVLDLRPTIVGRNYRVWFYVRVGHDESDAREQFADVPFDFANNPPGLIPFLCLVMELYYLHLHAVIWGTTNGACQVRQDDLL